GGVFEAGRLDEAALLSVLDALPAGDFELGCHPGEGAPHVPEDPAWRYSWGAELAALTSPRVKAKLVERGIALSSYGALS
ncbi:ChbG/HpnK family deacetylase, partial [Corallococcus sicarius]